jgi:hypothetical protein
MQPPSNFPSQQSPSTSSQVHSALPGQMYQNPLIIHSTESTSSDPNSDIDDEDDNGELPAQGLVAPWEILRCLADITTECTAKVKRLLTYLFNIFLTSLNVRKPMMVLNYLAGQGLPHQKDDPANEEKQFIAHFKLLHFLMVNKIFYL